MIQDSKSLGYAYVDPQIPDYTPTTAAPAALPSAPDQSSAEQAPELSEDVAVFSQKLSQASRAPAVLFPDTKCTNNTYYIHVGLDKEPNKALVIGEPGYIGHITRLGMVSQYIGQRVT